MSWFQNLDQIAQADPATVGYSAYYLGQLKQHGLPVTDGWVCTTATCRQFLSQVAWPQSYQVDGLTALDISNGEQLQQTSQAWQRALLTHGDPPPDGTEVLSCPLPLWIIRSSLWFETPRSPVNHCLSALHGLFQEQVGRTSGQPLLQALSAFWGQALKARNLAVWRQYCTSLNHLGIGTLVMPLHPAQVTGRLTWTAGQARIEAVVGLGLPLTRGEAIPARCQVSVEHLSQTAWQAGHQDQLYRLRAPGEIEPGITSETIEPNQIQVVDRPQPELIAPLNQAQLKSLLQLAERAQSALPGEGIQIEWVLCPAADTPAPAWIITQALPWMAAPSQSRPQSPPLDHPLKPVAAQSHRSLQPPPLPQVSVVVKGIGASSGQVRGRALVVQHPQDLPRPLPEGCIVVLPDLQPDRFLQLKTVAGIVTEQGGATCHAAILARERGIPAVVGAPQATQLLDPNLILWLDGDRGLVYGIEADAPILGQPEPASASFSSCEPDPADTPRWPFPTDDKIALRTKVMVNLSQSSLVKSLPLQHLDGIGLLRSEWLMLEILDHRHPWHWVERGQGAELQTRLTQALVPILEALGDKPVRYRSLDLRSHEWQSLEGSPPPDTNPMLGLRGTLSYGLDPRLFEVELGALATLQQSGYHNLQLMLPFVRSVEEVIACRQYIDYAGLSQDEGFALWIMAEVPSVLFLLPAYARAGVQGIAIGSNDLTQLLLAVDRDQRTMASAYDERHPVVRMALTHLIQEARRCGMTCSICGQAPVRHPELIPDLVAWGVHSISVEAAALPFTLKAIWQAEQQSL